jgi:hypothetical protein
MRIVGRLRLVDPVDPALGAVLAAFLAVKVLEVLVSRPVRYPDSPTYRSKHGFLDFSLTSLTGNSIRPWGVTAWMALWPSDRALAVAQSLLAFVAWSALALAVAETVQRTGVRRVVVVVLLLIPATAQVAGWDLAVLGESVSVSTGVLALAALIHLTREESWGRAVLFLLAALWFTMTRPNVFVLLLAWAVALLVVGLLRRQALVWAVVAAVLVVFAGYSYAYNIHSDQAWTRELGYSRTTVAYAYPVSANGPVAKAILADLRRSDAPPCMIPAAPRTVSDHGTTHWVIQTVAACPGMDTWATDHWNAWYARWLLHHPGLALKIVRIELPNSLSPPVWTGVTAATPDSVSQLFFGSPARPQSVRPDQTYRTQPLIAWLAAAGALALFVRWRRPRRNEFAADPEATDPEAADPEAAEPVLVRRWPTELMLTATVAGGLASAISSGLLIQTMPGEVGQESMGALVALTVSAVLLVGIGVDRLWPSADPYDDDVPVERG